jgi:hypothetical protein
MKEKIDHVKAEEKLEVIKDVNEELLRKNNND